MGKGLYHFGFAEVTPSEKLISPFGRMSCTKYRINIKIEI
jgi:hypothetical protein